jgi:hypothetical protein
MEEVRTSWLQNIWSFHVARLMQLVSTGSCPMLISMTSSLHSTSLGGWPMGPWEASQDWRQTPNIGRNRQDTDRCAVERILCNVGSWLVWGPPL